MNKRLFLWIGCLLFLIISCVDEHGRDITGPEKKAENQSLRLQLRVPGSQINTYASVEAINGEDEISSLYILFFEPSEGGTGKFIQLFNISPPEGQVYKSGTLLPINLGDSTTIGLSNAYNILIMANAKTYLETSYGGDDVDKWNEDLRKAGVIENDIKRRRIRIDSGYEEAQGTIYEEGKDFVVPMPNPDDMENYDKDEAFEPDKLVMSASVFKEADQEEIEVLLTRIVCRFDVYNNADGYELTSASIWNGARMGTIWADGFTDFSIPRIARLYGLRPSLDSPNQIVSGLYTYENYVVSPTQNDTLTTCLIVGLKPEGAAKEKITYYRVNASIAERSQQLRRNNAYSLNISSVKGPGANTEKDAYLAPDNLLVFRINEWEVDNQGNIQIDGDNIMAISTNNIVFTPLGGEREYKVFTVGEGTLEISQQELPTGIEAYLLNDMLYVKADSSEADKHGYVELKFGKLMTTIDIRQSGSEELFLELSHSSIPMFPNGVSDTEKGEDSDIITVTSSGSWTASLYNHDNHHFKLTKRIKTGDLAQSALGNPPTISGEDGDMFYVTVMKPNGDTESKYAFVHIQLDDDPETSRVLIVSQHGSGDVKLYMDEKGTRWNLFDRTLFFNPDGDFIDDISGSTYFIKAEINVDVASDVTWSPFFVGTDANFVIPPTSIQNGQFEVKAKGRNIENGPVNATLRVALDANKSTYAEIPIVQKAYQITVSETLFGKISNRGGSTQNITVSADGDWSVTLESVHTDAYFDNDPNKKIISGNANHSETFVITFPPLEDGSVEPSVTFTASVNGTKVKRSFTIYQHPLKAVRINVQSLRTTYGQLHSGGAYRSNYVNGLYTSLENRYLFGKKGTVFIEGVSYTSDTKVKDETNLMVCNLGSSAARGKSMWDWVQKSPNNVLISLQDLYADNFFKDIPQYTGVNRVGNSPIDYVVPATFGRSVNVKVTDHNGAYIHPIYEYLFRSGPFTREGGEITDPAEIFLLPYDGINNLLSEWPETMLPLITYTTGGKDYLLLGIDPTNRFIFCGEMELFGNAYAGGSIKASKEPGGPVYNGADNYYKASSPHASVNERFMNNLLAWAMNVILYGNDFNKQFTNSK